MRLALRDPGLKIHIQNEYRTPFYYSLNVPRSVKYGVMGKLYLNRTQRRIIWKFFGDVRFVWNQFLEASIRQFKDALSYAKAIGHPLYNNKGKYQKQNKKYLPKNLRFPNNFSIVSKLLTSMKKKYPWLKQADGKALQNEVKKLYDTYKQRVFKGLAKQPHFKSRKSHYQSWMTNSASVLGDKLSRGATHGYIPKLGYVKFHLNRHVSGGVKSVTVRLKPDGNFYISLIIADEKQANRKTGRAVGIDLGIAHLLNLSDGQKINFKYFNKAYARKLRRWQHKFAKRSSHAYGIIRENKAIIAHQENTNPGSEENQELEQKLKTHYYQFHNIRKARIRIARMHHKITNQRYNYLQQITTKLVKDYDFIALEDLDVKKMMMSKNTIKSNKIACAAWRMFRSMLTYKCKWYGKTLVIVNPFYTSQICYYCHTWCGKHPVSQRSWQCKNKHCPYHQKKLDRDVCSAKLILQLALHQVSPFVYHQIPKYKHGSLQSLQKFTETIVVTCQTPTLQAWAWNAPRLSQRCLLNAYGALNCNRKVTFPRDNRPQKPSLKSRRPYRSQETRYFSAE